MQKNETPDKEPYVLQELDEARVLARFAPRVDHPRPGYVEPLQAALRSHERLVLDLTATRTLISGWIRVLRDLSLEAHETGKVVGIVAMHPDIRESADLLQCLGVLKCFETVDEVWAS